jgi:hypothetical protein
MTPISLNISVLNGLEYGLLQESYTPQPQACYNCQQRIELVMGKAGKLSLQQHDPLHLARRWLKGCKMAYLYFTPAHFAALRAGHSALFYVNCPVCRKELLITCQMG